MDAKLSTGVSGLDEILKGGLSPGYLYLLQGYPGTGKTTMALQFLLEGRQRGENVLYVTLSETHRELADTAAAHGWTLDGIHVRELTPAEEVLGPEAQYTIFHDPLIKSGNLQIKHVNPAELSPGEFASSVRAAVEKEDVDLVIIDSLNGYFNSMPGEEFLALQMHELLSFLNEKGVATLMILAQHGFVGQTMVTPVDVSYLADTVCVLRFFEAEGEVKQAISVLKNRSGDHERTIREFRLREGKIKVGQPLSEFRGVLTGVPVYTGVGKLIHGDHGSGNIS